MKNGPENFVAQEFTNLWREYGIDNLDERWADALTTKVPAGQGSQPTEADQTPQTVEAIQTWLGDCHRCRLSEKRNRIVFGVGSHSASLMFVGEGPGADEDRQGIPFVGRAGQLLTKIIEAMGLARKDVYIANVVKCRPPNNRTPLPDEVESCFPFLRAQIECIAPKWIVALGRPATVALTERNQSISSLRGRFVPLSWDDKIFVMPTYHPAYLLRNPGAKRLVWADMKLVMAKMGK